MSPSQNAQRKPDPAPAARKRGRPRSHFDTMRASGGLVEAGFDGRQAKTIVNATQDVQGGLATEADLDRVELSLQGKMDKMESGIRSDVKNMETGFRADMKEMGHHIEKLMLESRIERELRVTNLQWFILATVGAVSFIGLSISYVAG